MATYEYEGKNSVGAYVSGEMDESSEQAAASRLMATGVFPTRLEEKRTKIRSRKLSDMDLLAFTRQFYVLVRSGVPLSKALRSLENSNQNPLMKEIFKDLGQSIDNGYELNAALLKHPETFGTFYVNMIRIGEMTGRMEDVLSTLYGYLEFESSMRKKAKSALRYPTFVFGAMGLAFGVVMEFVIPAFAKVYSGFGAKLPAVTRALIAFSEFVQRDGALIVLGLVLGGYLLKSYVETDEGKLKWDRLKFKLPIIGKIVKKSVLARFSKAFALTIKSGIPTVQALGMISQTLDNSYMALHVSQMRESVEKGNGIFHSAKATGVFEPLVLEMLATGEESGELELMTEEISELYEKEIEYELNMLSDNIEPIVMALLGGLILTFALGVLLPSWDLSSVVLGHKK